MTAGTYLGVACKCNLPPSFSAGDSIVKNWIIVVVGSVLAVVVSTYAVSQPLKLYFALVAFERSTNSVVRHALGSLTGQPGRVLKAHSEPPRRCSPSQPTRLGFLDTGTLRGEAVAFRLTRARISSRRAPATSLSVCSISR